MNLGIMMGKKKDLWNRCFHSLWKSLDSAAILYTFIIGGGGGDGFICLDTKENALVAAVEGAHPEVFAMDFTWSSPDGSGPYMLLRPNDTGQNIPNELASAFNTGKFSLEEGQRYLGHLPVERVFLNFKRLIVSFLYQSVGPIEPGTESPLKDDSEFITKARVEIEEMEQRNRKDKEVNLKKKLEKYLVDNFLYY